MIVLTKNFDDKAVFNGWLDATSDALRREVNRVSLQAFPPTVADWQAQNRPDFQTEHNQSGADATSTITAIDQDKPLYPWVHITGTRPHQIRATKPHGLLVFPIGTKTVFTSNPVNHPGFKPTGEVEQIQNDEYPKVADAMIKAGSRAVG